MTIKNILVAYSGDADGAGAIHLSLQMAEKYGAHVTGVIPHGPTYLERHYSRLMKKDILDIIRSRDEATVAEIRRQFESIVSTKAPNISADFLDLNSNEGFTLASYARSYDIVIMGRGISEPGRDHFGESPNEVAMKGGRPVLLVPASYEAACLSERALVAWDNKRAVARAVGDAMQILGSRTMVTVLSISEEGTPEPDVLNLFKRHGIQAEHLVHSTQGRSISATILDACLEVNAGLLIMGAYEHNPTFELLFGGVTHDIIEDAHLPVLLSH